MLDSTYFVAIFCVVIQGLMALQYESVALMYPQRSDVTVDAGTDLSLGCRGAEPISWTFNDAVNGPYFNISKKNITYIYNDKEIHYKNETILTVYNVSRENVGFYYCHGTKVDFDTPRRSSKIYVFVRDDNHLMVNASKMDTFEIFLWSIFVPCRPTAQDINVTVICFINTDVFVEMSVNPGNYTGLQKFQSTVGSFHPYSGFTIELRNFGELFPDNCDCVFRRNNQTAAIRLSSNLNYYFAFEQISIEGPDTANVGGDIKLQCLLLLDPYFPYDKYVPYWELPITKNTHKEHVQVIKLKFQVLLINTITMHNISTEDEGYYTCQLDTHEHLKDISRYVFVNDMKSNHSAPRIYSPTGDEIEINAGANITLRCAGSRPVTWAEPEYDGYQVEHVSFDGFHHTYLYLTNLSYFDIGLYRCIENRSYIEFGYEDNEDEVSEEEESEEEESEVGESEAEEREGEAEEEIEGEGEAEEKREEGERKEGKEGEDEEEELEEEGENEIVEEVDHNPITYHAFTVDTKYMFVKDEHNLYVPHEGIEYAYPYTNVTVPCLSTSRDVNVSISSMRYETYDPKTLRWSTRQINPVIYAYNPKEGFIIQIPGGPVLSDAFVTCTFVTETTNSTLDIEYFIRDYVDQEPLITGPDEDLVFVSQTLELSCVAFVLHNVSDDALRWTPSDNFAFREVIEEINRIKFTRGKILISKLILHDVEHADEGRYFCHLRSNNATTNKFITVYDQFAVRKPFIQNLTYDYAYIGQPLVLRCKVAVDHNVGFKMSWTTPNHTEIQNLTIELIQGVRNTTGQIIFKIDNITQENQGNYSCNVFYSTNRRNYISKHILVKKGEKPRIVTSRFKDQEEIVMLLEETTNLTCSAEGDPKPVITWMKDSTAVRRLGEHIGFAGDTSELTVHYVQMYDAQLYTCIAENPFGQDSRAVNLRLPTVSVIPYYAVLIFFIILITVAIVLIARRAHKHKKLRKELNEAGFIMFKSGELQRFNSCLNMAEQAILLSYDTKWEIPRNLIELGRNLGSGYFGLVVEATVTNFFDEKPEKTVAVKMLHRNCNIIELNSLICELKILSHLEQHVNLINLLGACTDRIAEGNLLVIIEYCEHGSLSNYLRRNRCNFVNLIDPDTELICFSDDDYDSLQELTCHGSGRVSTLELLRWAQQVACGMEFLASKQILHGDLAVRNVLLDENYVVKISDFGLSKNLSSSGYYKKTSQCPLPVKWMAIESIRDKTFSTQSDVWAFGVLLWELFSLARTPYSELEPDLRFYRKLESGYRLKRPEYSTREIYQVMRECWCARPSSRPTFSCLVQTLHDLLHYPNKHLSAEAECMSDVLAMGEADHAAVPDWIALDILPLSADVDDTTIT